ncbi:gibberellin-regulated protein 3-like [Malania oleifera]|uniref:gibberellin-regulated protein 3-like n=1 Tax=Malania oleifera TaxID=397392 RepID=UPI0025AE3DF6|nr:gibberellin-regulated protein 3-like [Malania oleifera]
MGIMSSAKATLLLVAISCIVIAISSGAHSLLSSETNMETYGFSEFNTPPPISPKITNYCGVKCKGRCKNARQNTCNRACNTCCHRCHCVPPGTFGHKETCPCYANMKTHGGRPKCP